jgi:hypothetical protein
MADEVSWPDDAPVTEETAPPVQDPPVEDEPEEEAPKTKYATVNEWYEITLPSGTVLTHAPTELSDEDVAEAQRVSRLQKNPILREVE